MGRRGWTKGMASAGVDTGEFDRKPGRLMGVAGLGAQVGALPYYFCQKIVYI